MDRWVDGWIEGGWRVGGEWGELKGEMSGLLGGVVIVLLSVCETKSFPNWGEKGRRRGRTEEKGEEKRQVGELGEERFGFQSPFIEPLQGDTRSLSHLQTNKACHPNTETCFSVQKFTSSLPQQPICEWKPAYCLSSDNKCISPLVRPSAVPPELTPATHMQESRRAKQCCDDEDRDINWLRKVWRTV